MTLYNHIQTVSNLFDADSPEGRMNRFDTLFCSIGMIGNFVEVGCGAGLTTRIMLRHAKQNGFKVLAIDPFESEWSSMPEGYGSPYPFSVFSDNTIGYRDELVLCRHGSLSSYSSDAIKAVCPVAFAFLDGIQYHATVLQEMRMMAAVSAEIICVDDINRNTSISQVPSAVTEFVRDGRYELVQTRPLIEGYLIRK